MSAEQGHLRAPGSPSPTTRGPTVLNLTTHRGQTCLPLSAEGRGTGWGAHEPVGRWETLQGRAHPGGRPVLRHGRGQAESGLLPGSWGKQEGKQARRRLWNTLPLGQQHADSDRWPPTAVVGSTHVQLSIHHASICPSTMHPSVHHLPTTGQPQPLGTHRQAPRRQDISGGHGVSVGRGEGGVMPAGQ